MICWETITSIFYRINATNDAGVGDFSTEYEYSTNIAPPAVLKLPKVVEVEQRTCTIEWLPSKNTFSDSIVYQVQVARLKEQAYKQVSTLHKTHCDKTNILLLRLTEDPIPSAPSRSWNQE